MDILYSYTMLPYVTADAAITRTTATASQTVRQFLAVIGRQHGGPRKDGIR
jgi:hypothetical protein